MSFHKQGFSARFGAMGDEAEGAFTERFPAHHRLGLNRPPMNVGSMPLLLRYTPDYMVADGFVEVMGLGRDQILKLKGEKVEALLGWNLLAPVRLFVWDSAKTRWWLSPISQWHLACMQHGTVSLFDDNKKPYWELKTSMFPCEPSDR